VAGPARNYYAIALQAGAFTCPESIEGELLSGEKLKKNWKKF